MVMDAEKLLEALLLLSDRETDLCPCVAIARGTDGMYRVQLAGKAPDDVDRYAGQATIPAVLAHACALHLALLRARNKADGEAVDAAEALLSDRDAR